MKKALIASTALILTAGVAAADVKISGYGRTGVIYYENTDAQDAAGLNETQVRSRLRMNIDASTSTDQGVDFGGRIRMQWDQNEDDAAKLNAGVLYVTASGLTVEVGNVGQAYDSLSVLFGSELGSYDRSVGARNGTTFAYDSDEYSNANRSGVAVKYSIDDLTLRASYIDPDQSGLNEDSFLDNPLTPVDETVSAEEEYSVSVQYKWNDRLELEAAYTMDGQGIEDNDVWYVGGRYAAMDNATVGLTYVDTSNDTSEDVGNTILLFGGYTLADGLTEIEAYVGHNNFDDNETDNAFGIGVNYDLGGARLGASIHRDYDERVTADMGVRFDF